MKFKDKKSQRLNKLFKYLLYQLHMTFKDYFLLMGSYIVMFNSYYILL